MTNKLNLISILRFAIILSWCGLITIENVSADQMSEPNLSHYMDEDYFSVDGLSNYKIYYEDLFTVYKSYPAREEHYNPDLDPEQIEQWKEAQSGVRSQLINRIFEVNDGVYRWIDQSDAGLIYPEQKVHIYTLDFNENKSNLGLIQPSETYFSEEDMVDDKQSDMPHFLGSPVQLLGIDNLILYLPKDSIDQLESTEHDRRTVYFDNLNGNMIAYVDKHPEYDRIQIAVCQVNPIHVQVSEYEGYHLDETLGIVVPTKLTKTTYRTLNLADRSEENIVYSQEFTIKNIKLLN